MKYRNSVGARLMLAFGGVIIVFAVAVALSIGRLAAFNGAVNDITHKQLAKVETADAWAASLSESMRHTRNMLIMEDKTQIQGEAVKISALSEKRDLLAQKMTTLVESAEGKAMLQTALAASSTLKPLDEEYLREVQAGDFKAAKNTLLERSRPAQLALIAALQQMTDHESEHIHGKADDIATSYAELPHIVADTFDRRCGGSLSARVSDYALHQEAVESRGGGARRDRERQLCEHGDREFAGRDWADAAVFEAYADSAA